MRISRFFHRPIAPSPIRPFSGSSSRSVTISPARSLRRRGSILIMVIAVLVLMALIGTAYVSVARIDRQAAATGSSNTQMTMLTAGVAQQVNAMILNNLFDSLTNYYRPTPTVGQQVNYHHYDSPFDDRDGWLASRVPEPLDVNSTVSSSNPVVWPAVSLLWNNSTPASTDTYSYYDPSVSTPYTLTTDTAIGANNTGLKFRYRFAPTDKQLVANGTDYPAMTVYTVDTTYFDTVGANPDSPTPVQTVLAADADGDGIADSLYFKLANQPDPNITYYGAVRVVDNNSAVNASMAWTYSCDLLGNGTISHNWGFFPSNVGLEEMLYSYKAGTPPTSTEMQALDQYRFGSPSMTEASLPVLTQSAAFPYDDPSPSPGSGNGYTEPRRSDYQFLTYGDMFEMQLDRRLDNPGYEDAVAGSGTAPYRLQALSWSDNAALADRFCLGRTASSTIETDLYSSLNNDPSGAGKVPTSPYLPSASGNAGSKGVVGNAAGDWYYDNFDYDDDSEVNGTGGGAMNALNFRPRRALLVGRDPVSDNVPWDINVPWYGGSGAEFTLNNSTWTPNKPSSRVNLNTGQFSDLRNAFLGVMNHCDYYLSPFQSIQQTAATGYIIQGVTAGTLVNQDVQKLRAALAAINTYAMRRGYDVNGSNVPVFTNTQITNSPTVTLGTTVGATKSAYVYSAAVQPYITEVVLNEVAGQPPYLVIKIYNPNAVQIDITNWQLATFDPGGKTLTALAASPFPNAPTYLQPQGSAYLVSGGSPPRPATGTSASETPDVLPAPTAGANSTVVPITLTNIEGYSLVLLRPVTPEGAIDTTKPATYAPVDQVDFTELSAVPANSARLVYYARSQVAGQSIYAGTVNGGYVGASGGTVYATGNWDILVFSLGTADELQTNTDVESYNTNTTYSSALGNDGFGQTLLSIGWTSDAPTVTPRTISLPLQTLKTFPSPNPITSSTGNLFPFGGFARDGDAFKIPFIGGYVITDPTNPATVYAISGIAYDSSYAEDRDTADDSYELIGQFYPIGLTGNPTSTLGAAPPAPLGTVDDYYMPLYQSTANLTAAEADHRYYFARFLLDYVGATATPNEDEEPNVDPLNSTIAQTNVHDVPNNPNLHPYNGSETDYTSVANHDGTDATQKFNNEYDQPNEGLININTAPWPVLAMLPMSTDVTGNVDPATNETLAKAIVAYRDRNGPFTSLVDLNRVVNYAAGATPPTPVPGQAFYSGGWAGTTTTPLLGTMNLGDSTPIGAYQQDCTNLTQTLTAPLTSNNGTTTFDYYQTKDHMNMLTRISNLITTRSDSFTVYILVEGWKNAGTANATRVSQVRQAYIVDRSQVSGLNKTLNIIPVPTN